MANDEQEQEVIYVQEGIFERVGQRAQNIRAFNGTPPGYISGFTQYEVVETEDETSATSADTEDAEDIDGVISGAEGEEGA